MTDNNAKQKQIALGEKLLKTFYKLIQTLKIHRDDNQLLVECAEDFIRAILLWQTEDEDELTIKISRERFYIQEEKLLYRPETTKLISRVLSLFSRLNLKGLRFFMVIEDAPVDDILAFGRLFTHSETQAAPIEYLTEAVKDDKFHWVDIIQESPEEIEAKKEKARRNYSYVLDSVKEVTKKLTSGKRSGIRKPVRMIQNMIDLMGEDEPMFQALSTIRIYDDYTYTHSVNVAILSMCIGKHIGLSRNSLERLGICGLLHDLGKTEIPKSILNKPGKLTDNEFEEIKKHSLDSVRLIINIKASRDRKARILLPPLEHHMKYDLTGYPQTKRKKPLSLFGKIIAIADVYDALTSPRIYRRDIFSPDRVLGFMMERAGKDFDPILLKVFIKMMGFYPVGTILKLDNGEMGMVINTPTEASSNRPKVLLLKPDEKQKFTKGRIIDLSQKVTGTDNHVWNIVNSFHPSVYGIQPAQFLF